MVVKTDDFKAEGRKQKLCLIVGAGLGTIVGAGLGTIVGAGLGTIVGAGLGTKFS